MRALSFVFAAAVTGGLAGCAREPSVTPPLAQPSSIDAPTTPRAMAAVAFASAQVGKPYCYGGTGPGCFDCSGLVDRAWAAAGVRLPRTSGDIAGALPEVPLDLVRRGDILWWPGHVGIYAGGGWQVEALDSRHGVVRRPLHGPRRAFRPL